MGWWVNKLWYIQTMQYYAALKRCAIKPWKAMGKLKLILLSERSQSEKAIHCMIPVT